jgi:hypothetical protein
MGWRGLANSFGARLKEKIPPGVRLAGRSMGDIGTSRQRPIGNLCRMPCQGHKMIENNAQSKGTPEVGHWLNFSPNTTDILHDFCGPHDIAGALCPNCNKPLMRLLSLYAKDERLGFDPVRQAVVHLLYCWTCSVPFGEFSYKVGSDGSVEVLQVPPRQPEMEFGQEGPYESLRRLYTSFPASTGFPSALDRR